MEQGIRFALTGIAGLLVAIVILLWHIHAALYTILNKLNDIRGPGPGGGTDLYDIKKLLESIDHSVDR